METILTVLITLGVLALLVTVWGVVRLGRKVDDLELVRMELIDLEGQFEKMFDDVYREIQQYQGDNESSLDRRFDNIWGEVHKNTKLVKTLDKYYNPKTNILKS